MRSFPDNPFPYSYDQKRYLSYDYHLKEKFGQKIFKVSLNGGFTCPNIDGTKGFGGCTYCDNGSGDFAGDPDRSLLQQFNDVVCMLHKKWKNAEMYIPYFQSHTNTYGTIERLCECFLPVLDFPGVVGLDIATRADCINQEVINLLRLINEKTYLMVELGLQTIFDETGTRINRCHTYEDFLRGYGMLRENNIPVCVHLINGLPGETHRMMVESARTVGQLNPQSVKLHLLHVIRGTKMAEEYENHQFSLMERDEYVDVVIRQLEVLPKTTIIQRLTGDGNRKTLIGPMWSLKKFEILNQIDKQMLDRNTYQGKLYIEKKDYYGI